MEDIPEEDLALVIAPVYLFESINISNIWTYNIAVYTESECFCPYILCNTWSCAPKQWQCSVLLRQSHGDAARGHIANLMGLKNRGMGLKISALGYILWFLQKLSQETTPFSYVFKHIPSSKNEEMARFLRFQNIVY